MLGNRGLLRKQTVHPLYNTILNRNISMMMSPLRNLVSPPLQIYNNILCNDNKIRHGIVNNNRSISSLLNTNNQQFRNHPNNIRISSYISYDVCDDIDKGIKLMNHSQNQHQNIHQNIFIVKREFSSRSTGNNTNRQRQRRSQSNNNNSSSSKNPFENQSPYDVLGIEKNATNKDIKLAYYKKAKEHHPDMHTNDNNNDKKLSREKFQIIAAAYELLSDPTKRTAYDSQARWSSTWNSNSANNGANSWQENAQRSDSSSTQQYRHWWEQQSSYHSQSKAQNMWTHFMTGTYIFI
jgi:DnaJ-domain-containing protein 1